MDRQRALKPLSRAAIIAAARDWIGTPYRHQASLKGAGCDCLGLVRGLWRELIGPEPEPTPAYTPDWAERFGRETLRDTARRLFVERPVSNAVPGDILLFRIASDAPAKHVGVLSGPNRLVHAYWARAVTETALTPWWCRRAAYAFAFPGVSD